jgi:uncharacterized membrane protein
MPGNLTEGWRRGLLFAAYPAIVYLLLSYRMAWLGTLLVFGIIVWKLHHRQHWLWFVAILLIGVLVSARLFGVDAVLKLSPLFIHISLFAIFTQSLSDTPLIERFARLEFGDRLPDGIPEYCRKLTVLWSAFFAANIVGCAWLAILGDDAMWVLYNGQIVYILIGALLLGEYLWRRVAFPDLEIPAFAQTVRSIVNNGDKIWGRK